MTLAGTAHLKLRSVSGILLPCAGGNLDLLDLRFASRSPAANIKSTRPSLRNQPAGRIFPQPFDIALQIRRVFQLTYLMTDQDDRELQTELARLQQEHRDLDAAIDALHQSPAPDLLRLQRLKKRKLQLRDRIAFIEDQITPDIIA